MHPLANHRRLEGVAALRTADLPFMRFWFQCLWVKRCVWLHSLAASLGVRRTRGQQRQHMLPSKRRWPHVPSIRLKMLKSSTIRRQAFSHCRSVAKPPEAHGSCLQLSSNRFSPCLFASREGQSVYFNRRPRKTPKKLRSCTRTIAPSHPRDHLHILPCIKP